MSGGSARISLFMRDAGGAAFVAAPPPAVYKLLLICGLSLYTSAI